MQQQAKKESSQPRELTAGFISLGQQSHNLVKFIQSAGCRIPEKVLRSHVQDFSTQFEEDYEEICLGAFLKDSAITNYRGRNIVQGYENDRQSCFHEEWLRKVLLKGTFRKSDSVKIFAFRANILTNDPSPGMKPMLFDIGLMPFIANPGLREGLANGRIPNQVFRKQGIVLVGGGGQIKTQKYVPSADQGVCVFPSYEILAVDSISCLK